MSDQRVLDEALTIWMNVEDDRAYAAAERIIAAVPKVELYCNRHRVNHAFTLREIEQLIYGLMGDLADTMMDGSPVVRPDEFVGSWCPEESVRQYRDPEQYAEHIEHHVESRLILAAREQEATS